MGVGWLSALGIQGLPIVEALWVRELIALGGLAHRYASNMDEEQQLVIALSLPTRSFAAVLVAAGWVLAQPIPKLESPSYFFEHLEPGTPIRVVTDDYVITDDFKEFDKSDGTVRLRKQQSWKLDKVRAAAVSLGTGGSWRLPLPIPGDLATWANRNTLWNFKLARPPKEVAIIGTNKWLLDDLQAEVTMEDSSAQENGNTANSLSALLTPFGDQDDEAFVELRSARRWDEEPELREEVLLAIFDGSSAISRLSEVDCAVSIALIDRSLVDDSGSEAVLQLRYSNSEPISLRDSLHWKTGSPIEALAFLRRR